MMFGDTPLHLVQTQSALQEAIERMGDARILGVDIEADGFHRYQEKVALIQISDLENDYVVDPMLVEDLSALGPLFADPERVKVLHGADYDIVSLRRDFGFQFNNLFDTMIAAQFLGLPKVGLADLIRRWFGHIIDKKYQRHDWSARPLMPEHLDYARGDTHFLPALRDVLTLRLRQVGRLGQVTEECELLTRRQWQGRMRDPSDFMRIKGSRGLAEKGLRALRALHHYREDQAAAMDRPTFKVMPDEVLLQVAEGLPENEEQLASILRRGSPLLRRHGEGLLLAVQSGLEDETPLPDIPTPARHSSPSAVTAREAEILLQRMRDWRNQKTEERGLPAVAVASNGLLKSLIRLAPRTLAELEAVPDIRRWQVAEMGEELLAIIAEVVRDEPAEPGKKRRRRRRRTGESAGTED